MAHKKLKMFLMTVCTALALVAAAGIPKVDSVAKEINGASAIAENSNYRLYLNEEDLSIVVEDKESGAYMESAISYDDGKTNETWIGAMKSAVVLTMINGGDDTKQADLINDNVKKEIKKTSDGFVADLYFLQYKIGMSLEVKLTDDGLVARIPDSSIKEDSDNYLLGTISIYPFLGSSYLDDKEGYLLVPDGNGALIYLNNKEGRFKSGFSSMIYGSDVGFDESDTTTLLNNRYNTIKESENIIAPVYGIAHTDDKLAFLAVVEDGAGRAQIECVPNGVSVDYNRAYAKFICRKTYTQPTSNNSTAGALHTYEFDRSKTDMQLRFMFVSGDKADYSGMASTYRDYLIKNGELVNADSAYKTRIDFLGTERENWLFSTTAVVMTTVDDVKEIYSDLKEEGLTDILSVYKGWQDGGLLNIPISKYKAESKIGGNKALTELIKSAKADGIDLFLYNNALLINPDEKNATFNVVKKINKRRYEEKTYMDVYDNLLYLIPERSEYMIDKFLQSYTKNGVNNLALAGVTNKLFSFNYSGTSYTRYDTQNTYKDLFDKVSGGANVIMEQPFAYAWKNTKSFLDMPLYTSSYMYEDESVPFLSMVLKGVIPVYSEYVNFEANKKEFFLKLIETGTYPSFYITKNSSSDLLYTNSSDIYSSEYSTYKSTILEYSKELKEINRATENATITKHEIDGSLVTVTYSNGVKVIINYANEDVTKDGKVITAMSYIWEK